MAKAPDGRRKRDGERKKRIAFDCRFTEPMRELFKRKRLELGLAYTRLGDLFGANWSTVRKWETGPTESCELLYRPLIEAFLNGDYDRELTSVSYRAQGKELIKAPVPYQVHQCMEKLVSTYLLCMHEPGISSSLLQKMDEVSSNALEELLNGDKETRPKERQGEQNGEDADP